MHFERRLVPSATSVTAGSSEVAAAIAVSMPACSAYSREEITTPRGVPVLVSQSEEFCERLQRDLLIQKKRRRDKRVNVLFFKVELK